MSGHCPRAEPDSRPETGSAPRMGDALKGLAWSAEDCMLIIAHEMLSAPGKWMSCLRGYTERAKKGPCSLGLWASHSFQVGRHVAPQSHPESNFLNCFAQYGPPVPARSTKQS